MTEYSSAFSEEWGMVCNVGGMNIRVYYLHALLQNVTRFAVSLAVYVRTITVLQNTETVL
jgi:low affinity Fe/Cu permease